MGTPVPLRDRLERDYRDALKARESGRVSVIRMVKAAIQNAEKARGEPLTDAEVAGVLTKETKLRRESLSEFERGGRPDLAAVESDALAVLGSYLPEQLSEQEIRGLVVEAIGRLPAGQRSSPRAAVGLVMRELMPQVRGRADGSAVNEIVRAELAALTEDAG